MNEIQGETVSKMNPEVKARWVAALRSGEYKQCEGALHKDGGFCCLGVLTDLAVKAGVGQWRPHVGGSMAFGVDTGLLPTEVSEWAGFSYPARMGSEVAIKGCADMLASHNDGGISFSEIADAIEAQL